MKPVDKKPFLTLIADVYAFHRQPFSTFAGNVWWEAMKPFDFAAVSDAITRHHMNPDSGQFLPKPADVVKMLGGTTLDSALSAWSKVDRAVRTVGTVHSVVFDDPLIHRVIADMGGWVKVGACPSEDEWPFVAKEFQNRYRGFVMKSEQPEYPRVLIGQAEAQNALSGMPSQPPQAIGDVAKCRQVYFKGGDKVALGVQPLKLGADLKLISSQ